MSSSAKLNYAAGFLNPREIIGQLGLRSGMSVAHFGCGTGFFTFEAARAVGDEGRVWALDVIESKLDIVRSRARAMALHNIDYKKVNLEQENGSELSSESMDWVLAINMLHQNRGKENIIREAARILKKTGHLLVIDWNTNVTIGPEKKTRVLEEEIIALAEKNAMKGGKIEAGQFHWGIVFEKMIN